MKEDYNMKNIVTDAVEMLGEMFERAFKNLWEEPKAPKAPKAPKVTNKYVGEE
jgi:hypothetical protein